MQPKLQPKTQPKTRGDKTRGELLLVRPFLGIAEGAAHCNAASG